MKKEGSLKPNGVYRTLEDFIFSSNKSNLVYYKEIYPRAIVPDRIKEFELPNKNYIGMHSQEENWWNIDYFENAYVAVLKQGRILGERGTLITYNNKIIHDYSHEWVFQRPEEYTLFHERKVCPISMDLKNAAILTHPFIHNYYHWLIDTIPRIHLLEKSGLPIEKYIVNNPYGHDLLNLFGISSEKIIVPDENTHIKVRNLIIPSQYYVPSKWACDFIRDKFLPKGNNFEKGNKKIYITRSGDGTEFRKILNEEVIFSFLEKEGFEKYELEKLSIYDKAQLFFQAEIVIGAHGAGLTNLVFCKPGTKVLEIFPLNWISPHYYLISEFYDLEYHYLIEQPIKPSHSSWNGAYDILVDESRFFEYYKKICG